MLSFVIGLFLHGQATKRKIIQSGGALEMCVVAAKFTREYKIELKPTYRIREQYLLR